MSYETFAKDKKVAVIAVLLVALAAYFIYRSWQSGQPHVTKSLGLKGFSAKPQSLQGKAGAGGVAGAPTTNPGGQ